MKEKRYFSRIQFQGKTTILYNEKSYDAELHDISLKGALVYTKNPIPVVLHQKCHVELELPGSDVMLDFKCEIMHLHNSHIGLKFFSVSSETLTHLRMLVEYNLGDREKTTNELAYWLQ